MGRCAGWVALLLALGVGVAEPPRGEDTLAALAARYLDGADVVPEFARWTTARVDAEGRRGWRRLDAGDRRACGAVLLLCEAIGRGSGSTRPVHRVAVLDLVHGLLKQRSAAGGCGLGPDAARRLYLLAGLTARSGSHLPQAHAVLVEGLRRHPRDAELLTALGTVQETIATLWRDERGRGAKAYSIEGAGDVNLAFALPRATVDEAIATFRAALAADPAQVEARLRLGRLLVLQRQPAAATAELARARDEATNAAQRSLALLFLARAHETAGDATAAREAYEGATREAPGAQTAWLGLARVADEQGARDEAQAALTHALQAERDDRDPWWQYRMGTSERRVQLLQALREEFRR
ncbi:MAG: tetratricopeptide repeat protein [Vicinamibacteria bacterium]|nr:tetratricopeptide repeat protein [Vicinamibacteria bacterium]